MMFVEDTTPRAYPRLVRGLSSRTARGSRAGEMRECVPAVVHSTDPRERYLFREDYNLAFQLQEHWAYWAGANPGHVERYNPTMERWIDDETGELPGSAYGDRMRNTAGHDQLGRALRQLREHPETRRAMVSVFQPGVEDFGSNDVSCTAYLHPFRRDGELHMVAAIRSQDVFWGYPYDAANNQFIQEAMAAELGLGLGSYTHLMDSAHYYLEYEEEAVAAAEDMGSHSAEPIERSEGHPWEDQFGHLTDGLSAARDGDMEVGVLRALEELVSPFARDWLKLTTAWEAAEVHGEPVMAEQFATWVQNDAFRTWITARV